MSPNKPVFVLGIGAQKAGTTFLYKALQAHPEVVMGRTQNSAKEMHVFNNYFIRGLANSNERLRREKLVRFLQTPPSRITARERRKLLHFTQLCGMQYDLSLYVRHFRTLLQDRRKRYTGDITPEYQILSASHFREIRALLEPHFDVRVIFLMRDPLDRLFSAMRMEDRGMRVQQSATARFIKYYSNIQYASKSQYESTIIAIEQVFEPRQLFYGFYEELFRPEEFRRLGDFLGLEELTADFNERINASPVVDMPGAEALAAARRFFAPTYDFCMHRFGEARIRGIWKYC